MMLADNVMSYLGKWFKFYAHLAKETLFPLLKKKKKNRMPLERSPLLCFLPDFPSCLQTEPTYVLVYVYREK